MEHAGQPVLADADRRHHVEPEQREVGEVVLGERLGLQVRVHEPQAAETDLTGAGAADVRQLELVRVADDHPLDLALAVHEHADLPVQLPGLLGEVAGELGAHDLVGRDPAAEGVPERLQLAGLETEGVAEDVAQVGGVSWSPSTRGAVCL